GLRSSALVRDKPASVASFVLLLVHLIMHQIMRSQSAGQGVSKLSIQGDFILRRKNSAGLIWSLANASLMAPPAIFFRVLMTSCLPLRLTGSPGSFGANRSVLPSIRSASDNLATELLLSSLVVGFGSKVGNSLLANTASIHASIRPH